MPSEVSLAPFRMGHQMAPQPLHVAIEAAARRPRESDLLPLVLYRGNIGFGRVGALYSYIESMIDASVESTTDLIKVSQLQEDFRHIPGLHAGTSMQTFQGFLGRLRANPRVMDKSQPQMRAFVHWLISITPWVHKATPIERYSPWSKTYWRNPNGAHIYPHAIGEERTPMPQVWPFINGGARDEHAMLLAIDAAVPKTLPEQIRQDVCQDLALAVLTGEIDITDLVTSAGVFVKQVFKQFPVKWGALSLDAPAPWANGDEAWRTLGEMLDSTGRVW